MKDNFQDLLADNSEVILDSLMDNEIIKEIPILGSSLKIIRGVKNLRDRAYLNKMKFFLENIGEINEEQRQRIIDEAKKNEKSRAKFGDAIFTTIEQSDSTVKIEYIAAVFEAFLNKELDEARLRLLCHIIRNSFADELTDIIENEKPKVALKYAVPSGLVEESYQPITWGKSKNEPQYNLSSSAEDLRKAWQKYGEK